LRSAIVSEYRSPRPGVVFIFEASISLYVTQKVAVEGS
jgi:hypothetical protein